MNKTRTDSALNAVLYHALDVAGGWISLADYMTLALHHPQHGYYRQGIPIGGAGDFITAPEISQVFGELLGAWCAMEWQRLGEPEHVTLLELGGGRGTLLNDALRATRHVAGFHDALHIAIVESSDSLRALQAQALHTLVPDDRVFWYDHVPETLPERPLMMLANEFFDALPVRQFVRMARGWAEVGVACETINNRDTFVLQPAEPRQDVHLLLPHSLRNDVSVGTVAEICPQAIAIVTHLARHSAHYGGMGIIIDYGYLSPPRCSTVQAIARHQTGEACADFLNHTGAVDLSTHVDMTALALAAHAQGMRVDPPITQAAFLESLGIVQRTAHLARKATPAQRQLLESGTARLIDLNGMGSLFKVLVMRAVHLSYFHYSKTVL